jgi:hypothetical protein
VDEREKNLPKWAQDLIAGLRLRIKSACEPIVAELAKLRPIAELSKVRYDAISELLTCAASGGHKTAEQIIEIIRSYDLILGKKD